MKTRWLACVLIGLGVSACSGSTGGSLPSPLATPPTDLMSRPSASPPAGLLSRADAIRIATGMESGSTNIRVVGAVLMQWAVVSAAYQIHYHQPAVVPPPPDVTVSPEPTPGATTWVWVVYFVEDRTLGTAKGLMHVNNITALEVIDARTGYFFAGQSGPFDVPPSGGK